MNRICKGAKIGLIIEIIAGFIMAILIIINKPVPTVAAWLFAIGVIIALACSLKDLKK